MPSPKPYIDWHPSHSRDDNKKTTDLYILTHVDAAAENIWLQRFIHPVSDQIVLASHRQSGAVCLRQSTLLDLVYLWVSLAFLTFLAGIAATSLARMSIRLSGMDPGRWISPTGSEYPEWVRVSLSSYLEIKHIKLNMKLELPGKHKVLEI